MADLDFYYPKDLQKGVSVEDADNGERDAVAMLYSDEEVEHSPAYPGIDTNYLGINFGGLNPRMIYTQTIKVLLGGSMQQKLSQDPGEIIRLRMYHNNGDWTYYSQIRGYLQKMPGFRFSDYTEVSPTGLVSEDQYLQMMKDYVPMFPGCTEWWADARKQYQWTDGIPKSNIMVKLVDGISADNRSYVANGMRSRFNDPLTKVFVKQDVVDSLNEINEIFNLMVYIIAAISLVIAFFLLLIATTQNVKEAVWEYGVLRSMGVTKEEGKRIQMYEAYIVITSASILGTTVGFITALTIGNQFFMFLELPLEVVFPYYLLSGLLLISFTTTWFAVEIPVNQVNKSTIANVLKAG